MFHLQYHLHASDDILRDEIVPINKKYPIKMLYWILAKNI